MGAFWQDLVFGARMLRKNPGFTAVAVLTLALGIGATTAIFSVVNTVLLRSLPYKDGSQLVILNETDARVQNPISVSYPDFLDWRQPSRAFQQMAAANNRGFNLSGVEQPENVLGYAVSSNFLSMLGIRPVLGRDLLPSEETPGTAPVVLLSYKMWQSHLGADPNAIGRSITLDGRSFTIIGILPPGFSFFGNTDVIAPIGVWAKDFTERGDHGDLTVIARMAPGVAEPKALAELKTIAAGLAEQYPKTNGDEGVTLQSMRDALVSTTRPAILILFGAVMFVLLIACVNVANLFLVRGAARSKEIALRLAFGASRGRIVRQMLTESFLLATIGGGLGIAIGSWALAGLSRLIGPDPVQGQNFQLNGSVFLFAAGMVLLVAVAFGLVPALQASRPDVQEALQEGSRGSTSGARQHRLRGTLAIAETALALVLLVGAGLMMKSLYLLMKVNPGFRSDHVLTMEMDLRSAQYSTSTSVINFWQTVLERVHAIPGVESAAFGTVVPLTGNHNRTDITFEEKPVAPHGQYPHPDFHLITPEYLRVMGIPLERGRNFTDADRENTPKVGLINATMARRYFPHEDPIGKRFSFEHDATPDSWYTIVGVVGDTKLYGLDNAARLEVYVPYRQKYDTDMTLAVRSTSDPAALTSAIRAAVASVDKDQPLFAINTMDDLVSSSVSTRHETLVLLGLFSALALILATIGIYGVVSYNVALRRQEIGIRVALGAQQADVLRMVLGQGARLALLGVGIGLVVALALTRLLSSLLFEVRASDPATFAGVAGILVIVALAACYVPARRAMKVDPMVALRHQ
jgi:putative ABC transport system permease protein